MKTITYTYDESKPTNRDYLIAALTDSIDEGDAFYVSTAGFNLSCPYVRFADCLNRHENNKYDSKEYREGCVRCKVAWLDREYGTYPFDDGKWGGEEK